MKKSSILLGFILSLFILGQTVFASITANSIPGKIFINSGFEMVEVYLIDGVQYYKIQDIAASVRGLTVRFTYKIDSNGVQITTGDDHVITGNEYSAASLGSYTTKQIDNVSVNGVNQDIKGYLINGNYCFDMKTIAKMFNCGWYELGSDQANAIMLKTNYDYNEKGELNLKSNHVFGNSAHNASMDAFAVYHEGYLYYTDRGKLFKLKDGETTATPLGHNAYKLNIMNDRIYFYNPNYRSITSCDLNGNDLITVPVFNNGTMDEMRNMIVMDDSIIGLVTHNTGWTSTDNIVRFELTGKGLIPTWDSNFTQLYSVNTNTSTERKIKNFYIDNNDIYFNMGSIYRIDMNAERDSYSSELVVEGEDWRTPSIYGDDTLLFRGKDYTLYSQDKNDKNNWTKFYNTKLNYYYMHGDRILHQAGKKIYSSNLDGSDRKLLVSVPSSNKLTVKFCVAGDYIVANSNLDPYYASPTIVKLDGTIIK